MRKELYCFAVLILIFCSQACRTTGLIYHLNILKTEIPQIPQSGWVILTNNYSDTTEVYQLARDSSRFFYTLGFRYFKKPDRMLFLDHYQILHFNISYYDDITNCYFYTELRSDTLYSFKSKERSMEIKEFIVGKYFYDYNFRQLNEGQKKYFEVHRDSLIKVRGDNLPRLPEIK